MNLFAFAVYYVIFNLVLWLCWSYVTADFTAYPAYALSDSPLDRLGALTINTGLAAVAAAVVIGTDTWDS